ncbi:DUF58 domain-containing protein [Caproiciproducens sp. CPB-2]|uniref:DUF58 domain-containing protein n=1 Tax=Caproiciproducens sp. CPB-2 TaxID=3030017 RepID=UPI0023DAF7FF|nr:DUF58 domain-containing protein [Caproiciproducens sp. CPB-2]MDF1493219.1 DUF58 domain-containing protein [Caproiciproducens sp. CPB-2]
MFRCRAAYCAVLAAAILFFIFFKEYLAFFTLVLILILPFFSWLFLVLAVRKTTAELAAQNVTPYKNQEFSLYITLKSASAFPLLRAKLHFSCVNSLSGERQEQTLFTPVNARSEQTAEYRMQSRYCGRITVKLTQLQYYDPLGIFQISRKPDLRAECFIAPRVHPVDSSIDMTAAAGTESNTYSEEKPGDDPSEIFDVRAFRSGDRLRSIHWKLSSKLDELMVKEFSLPVDSGIRVLLELLAPDMETLDALMETAASLSHFFTENRIIHRIEWYGKEEDRLYTSLIQSDEDLASLLNSLLSAQSYREEPYVLKSRSKTEQDAGSFSHAVYITGKLTEALTELCDRPNGEKITVLFVGGETDDEQLRLADALRAMNAEVATVHPEKIQQCLSGLIL